LLTCQVHTDGKCSETGFRPRQLALKQTLQGARYPASCAPALGSDDELGDPPPPPSGAGSSPSVEGAGGSQIQTITELGEAGKYRAYHGLAICINRRLLLNLEAFLSWGDFCLFG
jgi:hypothetical protein